MHERILLCDDDAITTASMGAALRDAGYLVSDATTVDQCLSVAASERHDLALIDVMIPPALLSGKRRREDTRAGSHLRGSCVRSSLT
jgi:DNA-binding response OmpR family regulator